MFDIEELTIGKFHDALINGETTCASVCSMYLDRINKIDKSIHSIIHISDRVLSSAQDKDQEFATTKGQCIKSQPLFGVPVILKDTYLTHDLPTTNGSQSFVGLKSGDANVVKRLREAGALILAKANCHEFCLQGCTFSSLGGQTLNPYDLSRTPGGSSGGTGASIAANLGLVGCGGDTMNSIRSPASACNLVGFRPTTGSIDVDGIFPVAPTQDTAGPLARSVEDARKLFRVMRTSDAASDRNVFGAEHKQTDRKLRIGILKGYFPTPTTSSESPVQAVMDGAVQKLKMIADFVAIPSEYDTLFEYATLLLDYDVQAFELKSSLNTFLNSQYIHHTPYNSLESINGGGQYDKRALSSVWHNTLKPEFNMQCAEYTNRLTKIKHLQDKLAELLHDMKLDAICYPHQKRLVMEVGTTEQKDRNGLLTALTGFPSLCIPAGFSSPTESAPKGVPIGMELVGARFNDDYLLDIGQRFEAVLGARSPPVLRS